MSAASGGSLLRAVNRGNLEEVTELLKHYDLFYCPEWGQGYLLLRIAITKKHFDVAKVLIQHGALLNSKSTKYDPPLHSATMLGQLDLVEMLLHYNAAINARNRRGETALDIALSQGNEDMVRVFLRRMVDQNLCEPFFIAYLREFPEVFNLLYERSHGIQLLQYTLIVASYNGNKDMVLSSLTAGADPNTAVDMDFCDAQQLIYYIQRSPSPLFLACSKGHAGVVKCLLQHGAQTKCLRPSDKYNSLHIAAENGHGEVVKLLLEKGVDKNIKTDNDSTPLHLAAKNGHSDTVQILLSKSADVNLQNNSGETALLLAVKHGHFEIVRILLQGGALVNIKTINNESPLYFAVWTKNASLVSLLLWYKSEMDIKIHEALFHIVTKCRGSCQIANRLCEYGFPTVCEDTKDYPLISAAVAKGFTTLVACLLTKGVDPNRTDNGSSLLHSAVRNGHIDIIELILNLRGDIKIKDSMGLRPISYVMKCGVRKKYPKIIQILLNNSADLRDAPCLIHEAVSEECFASCELLIKNGAKVNVLKGSYTPLLTAASRRSITLPPTQCGLNETAKGKIIKLLLNKRADFKHRSDEGNSALHLAASNGDDEAARILLNFEADKNKYSEVLQNKANIYTANKNRETPLHCAVKSNSSEIVKLLMGFDADVDAQNSENATALHEAVKSKNETVVNILLANGADVNLQDIYGRTALNLASPKTPPPSARFRRPEADKPIALILKRHIIKLKAAKLYISDKNMSLVHLKDNNELNNLLQDCENEVQRMKCKTFSNFCTLYDVFKNQQNPAYAKNEILMETLLSLNYEEFPIYQSFILNRLKKSKMRLELLTSGQKWLDILLKTSNIFASVQTPVLPFELLEDIVSLLSNWELRNLSICGEDLKRQVCE